MQYTIGELSKICNLPTSTLRYYDKLGLFSKIERDVNNNRIYTDYEVLTIKWIDCLKETGMPLNEIKDYLDMNSIGDSTLKQRYDLFVEREKALQKQMDLLQINMAMVQIKKWRYEQALILGSESAVDALTLDQYPKEIVDYYILAFGEFNPNNQI